MATANTAKTRLQGRAQRPTGPRVSPRGHRLHPGLPACPPRSVGGCVGGARAQAQVAASIGCAASTEAGRSLCLTSGRRGRNVEARRRLESAGSRAFLRLCCRRFGPPLPSPGGERLRQ